MTAHRAFQGYARTLALVTLLGCGSALAAPQDFSDQDLRERNFQNENLDGSNFTRARLNGANLNGVLARNSVWEDAEIGGAFAAKADFTGSDFRHAIMPFIGDEIKFADTDMRDLDMGQHTCYRCVYDGADLRGTNNWGLVTASSFRKADLRGADLRSLSVTDLSSLEMFIGAVYDDSTIWPDWVDMKKLRARKIGPNDPAP